MGVMNEIAAELRRVQDEVLRLRPEIDRLRRNEEDILARAHQAGYSTPHGESDSITEAVAWMAAELTRLRQIEAAARAANLIDEEGKVRRVLGTLPVTRDGVIVPLFENLWFIDRFATKNCDGKYGSAVARAVPTSSTLSDGILEFRASFGVDACRVSECYSTPEAAQAAKEAKK